MNVPCAATTKKGHQCPINGDWTGDGELWWCHVHADRWSMVKGKPRVRCFSRECEGRVNAMAMVKGVQYDLCWNHLNAYTERVYREAGSTPYAIALAIGEIQESG